jgi:DNA-binding transcriptional LysR family regulator
VYGAKRYLRTRRKLGELDEHDWIALDDSLSQHATLKWLAKIVPVDGIKLRTNSFTGVQQACAEGLGLAVLPCFLGDGHAALQRVTDTLDECNRDLWLLTHPDLRHTTRVKAVFQVMHEELSAAADVFAGKRG